MGVGVGVISAREVAVVRCHDGVLLALNTRNQQLYDNKILDIQFIYEVSYAPDHKKETTLSS